MLKRIFAFLFAVCLLTAGLSVLAYADSKEVHDGDLLVMEVNDVTVKDTVSGDLLAICASVLRTEGQVQGSIRAAGSELILDGTVDRNVTVAGITVETKQTMTAADAAIFGSLVTVYGNFDSLAVYGETVIIGAQVEGELTCEATQIILLEGASFEKATLRSQNDPAVAKSFDPDNLMSFAGSFQTLEGSAFADKVTFEKLPSDLTVSLQGLLFTVPSAILLALAVMFFMKNALAKTSLRMNKRPAKFLLRGLGLMFLLPIVSLLLIAMVFTMALGGVLLLLFALLAVAAEAITAALLARLWLSKWNPYLASTLFAAIISVVTVIPFLGAFITFACMLVAFGMATSLLFDRKKDDVPADSMDFRV